uniref:Uncharacterized protein n=1 Tax=Strigamia maritima TaxID=126957 RepID=T1IPT4_STRMM
MEAVSPTNSELAIEEIDVDENSSTSSTVNYTRSELVVPSQFNPEPQNQCVSCIFWNYVRMIVFYFMMYALKRELTGENVTIFKTAKTLYKIAKHKDRN